MVKIEMMDGSNQTVQVDGGGSGRSIILRVTRTSRRATEQGPLGPIVETLATVSLGTAECEAIENALRIQRRVAERK